MAAPVVAEPAHRCGDRILVLDVFLERIRVVEPQMARAAVFRGEPEVQDDRLGVTVMQVAIGLRRKPRDDASAIRIVRVVFRDDRAQEVRAGRARQRVAVALAPGVCGRAVRRDARGRIPQCSMERFVHEQGREQGILIASRCRVIGRLTRRLPVHPGSPRRATVCGRSLYEGPRFFPQILWIAVCISCKFDR